MSCPLVMSPASSSGSASTPKPCRRSASKTPPHSNPPQQLTPLHSLHSHMLSHIQMHSQQQGGLLYLSCLQLLRLPAVLVNPVLRWLVGGLIHNAQNWVWGATVGVTAV